MRVFFRYDDFSNHSSSSLESSLFNLFAKHHISCLYGVVPFVCAGDEMNPEERGEQALSSKKIALLHSGIEKGVTEVALHGCTHQTIHPIGQRPSEFRGASLDAQIKRISRGKKYLESSLNQSVTMFIPPWNDYDRNTIVALAQLGFNVISTGKRFGVINADYPMKYVPISCELSDVVRVVEKYRVDDSKNLLGILLHPYDFLETGDRRAWIKVDDLEKLILWLQSHQHVRIFRFIDIIAESKDLSEQRYEANLKLRKLRGQLPKFLKFLMPDGIYFSLMVAQALYAHAQVVWRILQALLILFAVFLLILAVYYLHDFIL